MVGFRIEEVLIKLTNLQDNKQDITVLQVRLIRGQRTDSRSQLGEPRTEIKRLYYTKPKMYMLKEMVNEKTSALTQGDKANK